MPYELFKKYLVQQLSDREKQTYDFAGSFAQALHQKTSHEEGVILLLALVPHILPHYLDEIFKEIFPKGGEISQLGGERNSTYRGFLPTGETAQYILAGEEIGERIEVVNYFRKDHWFYLEDILQLENVPEGEPIMSGKIILSKKAVSLLLFDEDPKEESSQFPAQIVMTNLDWEDLILTENTKNQVEEILAWEKNKTLILKEWKQEKFFKKGFRVLFYGPSGTGKTLTASLLGKELSRLRGKSIPVYRIDLSMMISKYIGETEKNLEKLFVKAEKKDWILFFDEGENFFSTRTSVRDSHDKYANQEVSYLLQRIEDFDGLIIVATNLKANMDQAFARRFQSMIEFKLPNIEERKRLWENVLPAENLIPREKRLVAELIKHNLSGGSIVNVVQYACLKAVQMNEPSITLENCVQGIKLELAKSGKTI